MITATPDEIIFWEGIVAKKEYHKELVLQYLVQYLLPLSWIFVSSRIWYESDMKFELSHRQLFTLVNIHSQLYIALIIQRILFCGSLRFKMNENQVLDVQAMFDLCTTKSPIACGYVASQNEIYLASINWIWTMDQLSNLIQEKLSQLPMIMDLTYLLLHFMEGELVKILFCPDRHRFLRCKILLLALSCLWTRTLFKFFILLKW